MMKEHEIKVLLEAAQALKKDPSTLKAENPFLMKGAVAEALQMAVESINPQQAAEWRRSAGVGGTLESVAAQAGVIPMTASAHQELMESDPDYATGVREARARREADLLAEMDRKADELRGRTVAETPQARHRWSDWEQGQSGLKKAGL